MQIRGKGFAKADRPRVTIGEVGAPIIIGSDSLVIARVPEGATAGELVVESGEQSSETWACDIGVLVAESLHPVANPAIDRFGNIITNLDRRSCEKLTEGMGTLRLTVGTRSIGRIVSTYSDIPPGEVAALFGSTDHLECSAQAASAADQLGVRVGDAVELSRS